MLVVIGEHDRARAELGGEQAGHADPGPQLTAVRALDRRRAVRASQPVADDRQGRPRDLACQVVVGGCGHRAFGCDRQLAVLPLLHGGGGG